MLVAEYGELLTKSEIAFPLPSPPIPMSQVWVRALWEEGSSVFTLVCL